MMDQDLEQRVEFPAGCGEQCPPGVPADGSVPSTVAFRESAESPRRDVALGGALAVEDVKRAICCPAGVCAVPESCYAMRRDRDVPVRIEQAAQAVMRLLKQGDTREAGRVQAARVSVFPLTTHKPGIVIVDRDEGIPQDSAWQPLPDRPPAAR
jgi:hypothetical protein